MNGKRSHQEDDGDSDSKRLRANDGSSVPASPASGGSSEVDKKRQDAMAKMAALKAKLAAQKPSAVADSPVSTNTAPEDARKAEAARKIAAIKAQMEAKKAAAAAGGQTGRSGLSMSNQPTQPRPEMQDQIMEVRAKAAAARRTGGMTAAQTPPQREEGRSARGGLGIGLHPSLLADTGPTQPKGKAGQQGPKFSTTRGNQQPVKPKINPYLATDDEDQKEESVISFDPSLGTKKGGERQSKQLAFNQVGKFIHQANALRQQAKLEDMKRRIAAETRKEQIEQASDKSFLVPPPPEVEWWDEGLLPEGQKSYDDWQAPGRNKIETGDTIVTALIQRPVLLQAPQDKFIPAPKPLMLTPKEQKKVRRQRRMADMKEEQAKIRLGLVPPPPPKVKKSNMMQVLGEQAVKDPTAVEARVNREIAERAQKHEQDNHDRMLSKEERADKLKGKQAGDEAKGVRVAVFKVDDLSSGKHRYKVDVNAKEMGLTGMVILNPEMNLIIVEGGNHSITAYKKLMLKRIRWTENTAPLGESQATTFTSTTDGSNANPTTGLKASGSKAVEWCDPVDENGNLKDLSNNKCVLVWEGDESVRSFKRWGSRACETDGEARDALSRQKMENMWTLARTK